MVIRAHRPAPPSQVILPFRFRPTPAPRPRREIVPPLQRILCAVDGSRDSAEALREAIALASPGAAPRFLELPQAATADPLLIARPNPFGDGSILVASDGSAASWAAARTATRLARAAGSELRLIYVPDGMHPERYPEVLKQLTMIEKATGPQPVVVDDPGRIANRICEAAEAAHSSLIVLGHRGLPGSQALGSVSELVVHDAQTSLLLVPPEAPTGVARTGLQDMRGIPS